MSITRLVELQDIDSQLEDLNSLLGDLPKMVDELNEKENSLKDRVEADKVTLKEINLNSSKSEKVNSDIQEKINKLTDQLFLVTNNKQYDALTNEIEHLKEQKKENEELLISNLEEKETLEKNINENEASLEELKTDLDVRRNKLDEALSETADEKAALENSRKKQVTEIDDNTMQVYNKVISARSGIAVVPLSGNSCGGCGAALPLQMVSEIRAGDLHNCQSCGRFVYNKKN
ncbi:MAG: C4-type zinc ribbon domain-containing protein [bacterium]|tara:strand:- start:98 stop:796 length:699 start_codon:yes stop_codon:yes gene_type:complete